MFKRWSLRRTEILLLQLLNNQMSGNIYISARYCYLLSNFREETSIGQDRPNNCSAQKVKRPSKEKQPKPNKKRKYNPKPKPSPVPIIDQPRDIDEETMDGNTEQNQSPVKSNVQSDSDVSDWDNGFWFKKNLFRKCKFWKKLWLQKLKS